MIENTIQKIEARINSGESLSPERKQELLQLLGTLKAEVTELSKTHGPQAQSIAGFTEISAQAATRNPPDPQQLKSSLEDLMGSAREFEKSHPRLVQIVNSITNTLSNLGI